MAAVGLETNRPSQQEDPVESVSLSFVDIAAGQLLCDCERLRKRVGSEELDERQKLVAGRLCSDERMKSVWRVLFQTNQAGEFSYPANPDALNPYRNMVKHLDQHIKVLRLLSDEQSDAELKTMLSLRTNYLAHQKPAAIKIENKTPFSRQLLAIRYLYIAVIDAVQNAAVRAGADITAFHDSIEDAIDNLREVAEFTPMVEIQEKERELRKLLLFSQILSENDPLRVKRNTSDWRLRGFVITMGLQMNALFGQSFYGSIATLANVSFERTDITLAQVRALIRNAGTD